MISLEDIAFSGNILFEIKMRQVDSYLSLLICLLSPQALQLQRDNHRTELMDLDELSDWNE